MRAVSSNSARRAGMFVASRWRHCGSSVARKGAAGSVNAIGVNAVAAAAANQCSPCRSAARGVSAAAAAAASSLIAPMGPRVSTFRLCLSRGRRLSSEAGLSRLQGGRRNGTSSASTPAAANPSTSSSSSAASFSLYNHPRLYDAAFAFRDFDAEAEFLLDAWRSYSEVEREAGEGGDVPRSFLDVGCGTGRHGAALARAVAASRKGSLPLSLYALDSSDAMLSAAEANAEGAGCPLKRKIKADFAKEASSREEGGGGFSFEDLDKDGVDVALCALGTLAHCVPERGRGGGRGGGGGGGENDENGNDDDDPALVALRNVAAALAPGGVLVLELPAAGDLFDGTLLAGDAWDVVPEGPLGIDGGEGEEEEQEEEEQEEEEQQPRRRIGQIIKKKQKVKKVKKEPKPLIVEYGSPDDDFDPVSQVLLRTVVVSEARFEGGGGRGGGGGDDDDGDAALMEAGKEIGREVVAQRLFTPGEVRSLAREAGFRVAAELGDMELGGPTAQEGDRYVAVLVKKKKK